MKWYQKLLVWLARGVAPAALAYLLTLLSGQGADLAKKVKPELRKLVDAMPDPMMKEALADVLKVLSKEFAAFATELAKE